MVHYTINLIVYINTLKKKYNEMYEKLIQRLEMYANEIRTLFKGYLPISFLPLIKLKEIIDEVKKPFKSPIQIVIFLSKDYIHIMI